MLRRTISTNMNQLAVNGMNNSPQLLLPKCSNVQTFGMSNHHHLHHHKFNSSEMPPLLAKTTEPQQFNPPSPPQHSVEEISLMSLEKDLRSLDENVNQVNTVNNKIKNGTNGNGRKNIIATSLLRLKILKFRQKNPTTL